MNFARLTTLALSLTVGAIAFTGCKGRPKKATGVPKAEDMVASDKADPDFVHANYRFKIGGLDNKWKILSPSEVKSIVPDASAGAFRVGGMYGVIIVEPLGDVDPTDYMELLISNMRGAVPQLEVVSVDDTDHKGHPAKEAEIDAVVNGIPIKYRSVAFIHQGHGYQLLCWHGRKSSSEKPYVQEFFDSVDIVEGEVGPPPAEVLADFNGVGRRVKDGHFESPIYRLTARALNGWSLMGELELAAINDSAELGMSHAGKGCYLSVIPERLTTEFEEYRADTLASAVAAFEEMGEVTEQESTSFRVAGQKVDFNTYTVAGPIGTSFFLGLYQREGVAYQIQAWHVAQKSGDFSEVIAEGIAGIGFMSRSKARRIESELAALPDPQHAVGPGFSLRKGVYRQFPQGIVWKKPEGIWRIATGDSAALSNPDSSMQAEALSSGVYLQLITEDASEFTEEEYHDLILENFKAVEGFEKLSPLPDVEIDGQPAKMVRVLQKSQSSTIEFRVATTIRGKSAHQIVLWSQEEIMQQSDKLIEEALQGFSLKNRPIEETEKGSNWYRDNRVGFRIEVPGSSWTLKENLHPTFKPVGNSVQFLKRSGSVMVMAINIPDNRNANETINNLLRGVLKVNLDRASESGANEVTTTIAGKKARVIESVSGREHLRAATFLDGSTIYLLVIGATNESASDKLLDDVKARFELLP